MARGADGSHVKVDDTADGTGGAYSCVTQAPLVGSVSYGKQGATLVLSVAPNAPAHPAYVKDCSYADEATNVLHHEEFGTWEGIVSDDASALSLHRTDLPADCPAQHFSVSSDYALFEQVPAGKIAAKTSEPSTAVGNYLHFCSQDYNPFAQNTHSGFGSVVEAAARQSTLDRDYSYSSEEDYSSYSSYSP